MQFVDDEGNIPTHITDMFSRHAKWHFKQLGMNINKWQTAFVAPQDKTNDQLHVKEKKNKKKVSFVTFLW